MTPVDALMWLGVILLGALVIALVTPIVVMVVLAIKEIKSETGSKD